MPCPLRSNKPLSFWQKAIIYAKQFFSKDVSASRLRSILDNTVDSIITINDRGIIQSFNKTAEKMFGYSKDEVIGKNVNILMPEPYHSQHDMFINNYLETKKAKIIGIGREVIAQRKDGSTFPIDLAVSMSDVKNKHLFTGIIRDITDKKESEKLKIDNLRIEAEKEASSNLVLMLSHDLRTPLHIIMGFTECLKSGMYGELNEQQKTTLDRIYKTSKHLQALVNGVLELMKISTSLHQPSFEKINVVDTLNQCLEIIEPLIKGKNIQIKNEIKCKDCVIEINPVHLREILINLLGNAAKFTVEGEISTTIECSNGSAMICIRDTGIGIKESDLPKIFIPFSKIDRDGLQVESYGIGLAITKKLIEQYKGTIQVKSVPQQGTTFTISLPCSLMYTEPR